MLFDSLQLMITFDMFSRTWTGSRICAEVSKDAKIRNRNNPVSHLTQDTKWESDKNTIKPNIQESQ